MTKTRNLADLVNGIDDADIAANAGISATKLSFTQNGSGAVARSVESKLEDIVSIKDFGAVGDGIADDTAAVTAAIASEKPLDWGGLTYKIVSPILQTVTKPVIWQGNGASVIYSSGSHTEYAIRLNDTVGVEVVINNITLDGGKLCNKVLEILNNTSQTTPSNFTSNNLFVKRAKRLNTFNGGDGLFIRGAFTQVLINGGGASDCELPAGQGTAFVAGIRGIGVTWYSTTSYVQKMVINGVTINKIYSSDLTYELDQDGVTYFAPDDPSGLTKIPSEFVCSGSNFVNCYGRSIKTQCLNTIVRDSSFERNEGFTSGKGNGEIDAQTGSGLIQGCTFSYSNNQEPDFCFNSSSGTQYGKPGLTAKDCEVFLSSTTTLSNFARIFPREGIFSRHLITNCKIFGKVQVFFDFLCNGEKNYAEVSNCYIDEIINGATSEKALVYAKTSGSTSPYSARLTAHGNVYGNTHLPALLRDGISGFAINCRMSAWNNVGFQDDFTNTIGFGLKSDQINRSNRIGTNFHKSLYTGYFEVLTKAIESGATETFEINNISGGCLLFIVARRSQNSYALISSLPSANVPISVGSEFAIGNTSNPGTAIFNVWSSGNNQISIQNTNVNLRQVTVFVLSA